MVIESPEIVVDGLQVMTQQLGVPLVAVARQMCVQPRLLDDLLGVSLSQRSADVVNLFSS